MERCKSSIEWIPSFLPQIVAFIIAFVIFIIVLIAYIFKEFHLKKVFHNKNHLF